jgi:hypothetical protein
MVNAMSADDLHQASHPHALWWIAILSGAFGGGALADGPPARVTVTVLLLLSGGLVFFGFALLGHRRIACWVTAAVTFMVAMIVAATSGTGGASTAREPSSPEVSGSPPSTTQSPPGPAPTSPATDPTSSTKSDKPIDLPSPRDITRVMTVGSSASFFDDTPLIVGYQDYFTTWASLSVASELEACSPNLSVGERAVVPASASVTTTVADSQSAWLRVTLLQLAKKSITIRIERIVASEEPASSPYAC